MRTTKSSVCNDIVKNIWLFWDKNKIWITVAHIPGAENVIADYEWRESYKSARVDAESWNILKGNKAPKI